MDAIDQLLERHGFNLDCESPFEISNEVGDRATGEFAELVVIQLKEIEKEEKGLMVEYPTQ